MKPRLFEVINTGATPVAFDVHVSAILCREVVMG
jgi:hypothetical protein